MTTQRAFRGHYRADDRAARCWWGCRARAGCVGICRGRSHGRRGRGRDGAEGRSRTPPIGAMASISGTRWVTSLRFAPVGIAAIGVPLVSMAMRGFGRGRARSVGFGPVFRPPQPHESTMSRRPRGREKSIFPAARGFASSTACSRSHTPVCCQSRNLRQQPAPVPHPISHGESRQRMPVFGTNRMPVKAARPATGLRPGYLKRRGFGGGSRGSIRAHSSSSMIGLPVASAHLPRRPDRTKPMSRPCRIGSDEVDIC